MKLLACEHALQGERESSTSVPGQFFNITTHRNKNCLLILDESISTKKGIFTEPEVNNCFSIITPVDIRDICKTNDNTHNSKRVVLRAGHTVQHCTQHVLLQRVSTSATCCAQCCRSRIESYFCNIASNKLRRISAR